MSIILLKSGGVTPGSIVDADIDNAAAIDFGKLEALTATHVLVGSVANVATDVAVSGDATMAATGALTIANNAVTTVKILNANVTLAKLAAGVTPSHVAKFAGTITWSGGLASLATTIAGLAATDKVSCTVRVKGTESLYILSAIPTTDTLTITLDAANTSNDCQIDYIAFRAAA